jgi:hypothetical protein
LKIVYNIILYLFISGSVFSQANPYSKPPELLLKNTGPQVETVSYTTASIGVLAFIYLINPILLYEDKKIYAGLTKEISVGFGDFGEHRLAFEYSFVFTGSISHHVRLSYKYDLLLDKKIQPSHYLQGTGALSLGAGYFTNFSKQGAFPELTLGYSIRNHKILIFPHIKIRHTFMFRKTDSDITDISFGLILGFANPFTDVKIKRDY